MNVTNHAIERMQERRISFEDLNRVVKNGKKRKIQKKGDQIIIKMNVGKYTVIMSDDGTIITAYKDNSKKMKRHVEKLHHSNFKYKNRILELKRKDYEDEFV